MATFELPEIPTPRVTPNLMLGAASPLWAYFGAAAAGGVAWWWMTRWSRAANLEALFDRAAKALPEAVADLTAPVADAAEAMVAAVEAIAPDLPTVPVGGEAAPISPVMEAPATPEPEPQPEPMSLAEAPSVEAPSVEAAPAEPVEAEPAKPRIRKPPTPNGSDAQA